MSDVQGEMLEPWVRLCTPPVASAKPADFIQWLRAFVRLSSNDMAIEEIYGIDGPREYGGHAETLMICIGMAERIGATRQMAILAARAEWIAAQERAAQFAEAMRRALWVLGRDRASGGEILTRAHAVNRRYYAQDDIDLREDDLTAIARKIVVAAATGRRPHGR